MSGMHIGESTMKVSELLEEKVEMCPKACCGAPVTECKCGPDCKHCDCHEKNKAMKETTSAGGIASVAGAGFASGGIGTLKRAAGTVVKKKKKKTH
jgi:hypothetical protein